MKNNRSGIVIAVILLVLLAAGLYYYTREDSGETGSSTEGSAPQTEQSEPADASGESASSPDSDSDANEEQQQTGLRIPTFDVLRVEPDGTAVIAGAAEPLGVLDVKEGDTVVASSSVGDSGDFVAIIETPLTPGDHLIYLDVTMPDGRTARSLQTATISIPETPDGDLLALITEPGKASEIIAAPDGDGGAPEGTVIARAPGSSGQQENGEQPSAQQNRDGGMASDNTTPTGGNAAQTSANEQTQDGSGTDSASDQAETQLQTVTVETDAEKTGRNGGQGEVVALVSIKAVEIEGNRLFVAGSGAPGATIRGYIDDALIGDAEINVEGNYVLDAEIDVSVGLHTIRVDMLDADGGVVARAVVPFDRPPGDQVAAVSGAPATSGEQQQDGTQTFTQPQLESSDNAVIIRRGDNLWRISRRMYGRGVRYTTIYLANEPQIVNPDLILPGQVFSVPKEPLPIGEAETIHRRLLEGMPIGPEYHLPAGDQ
ncbi:LysM peptidoglycan-binding domain-containing protein [Martelella mediterranea]|uniref:LysM domain/BON superfamily protein n=1 Tax=Martelella mediterranea DSM 17316 TaxID=1122214 RepID=A0A1U9Z2P5_9HYPH|nr:LysM peptidoglycan-binding domain-containing protein [Martelella mediterranea]AQZ51969.1 LysM domain/BON superfamily protein [Martelella mediterranea DSM 17316]